jgi:hypothetical protein
MRESIVRYASGCDQELVRQVVVDVTRDVESAPRDEGRVEGC